MLFKYLEQRSKLKQAVKDLQNVDNKYSVMVNSKKALKYIGRRFPMKDIKISENVKSTNLEPHSSFDYCPIELRLNLNVQYNTVVSVYV